MSEKTVKIRIDLDGKTRDMFEAIKKKFNLETYTETIRLIIKLAFDNEFKNNTG